MGVYSQSLYEYTGHPISGGARTAALGGAAVGEAYDANSLFWNPAALSFIQKPTIMLSSIFGWNRETLDNTLSLPPFYIGNKQVVAFGITGSYYGKSWSQPFFSYQGLDFGYSIKLNEAFSLGFRLNLRYGKATTSGLWATSGTIGGFYSPSPGISYGVVFDGIGSGILYKYSNNISSLAYEHLKQNLRFGTAFKFPSIYRPPFITISLESEKIMGEKKLIYEGGVETYPFYFLSLRTGLITNTNATGGTLGVGFIFNRVTIDYALSRNSTIQQFHQISFSYNFAR
jgi:hypothetical protein